MDIHTLADHIIVWAFITFLTYVAFNVLGEIVTAVEKRIARHKRNVQHDRFVAARVAAREECETRFRAEGRWDNFEMQDAMDAAGKAAAPGYRP